MPWWAGHVLNDGDEAAQPSGVEEPARRARWRSRRAGRIGIGIVALIALCALIATFITIPYYAITPGQALAVSSLIAVPRSERTHQPGSVLLTDVELVPLRAIDYPFYKLNGDDEVLKSSALIGPLSPSQYNEQGVIDMDLARQAATVVALGQLGYRVSAKPDGVVVYQPEPGSPAASLLPIGTVLSAIDGRSASSFAATEAVLQTMRPGEVAKISTHLIGDGEDRTVRVELGTTLEHPQQGTTCLPASARLTVAPLEKDGHRVACLGIYLEQVYATVGEPFAVTIDAEGIIGPSAGLAFTLGVLQELDPDSLTAGRKVAATGTMSVTGQVGDVGGVAQKTVAVRDAGASIFFVPPEEYAVAKAHAGRSLKVVAVSSLSEAVRALEQLGGKLARPAGA